MVRVVLIGLGSMGCLTLKYLVERKAEVVGVFTRSTNVGDDAGLVAGIGKIGVSVSAVTKLETLLPGLKPDICLLLTTALITEMEPTMTICTSLGFNTYCLGEESYFPGIIAPEISAKLDKIAKEKNCTISGGGIFDACWGHLVTVLSGCAHNMKEININCVTNMDRFYQGTPGFGADISKSALGFGMTPQEFTKTFPSFDSKDASNEPSGIAGGVTSWLCDYMKWTITSSKQYYEPLTATKDVFFKTFNSKISAGHVMGCREVTIRETKEGIRLVNTFVMKAYDKSDVDVNDITIIAEPEVRMSIKPGNIAEFSCINMVNRIRDIIAAPAGYITTNKLPPPRYTNSLSH